jgi:hypothetical protein
MITGWAAELGRTYVARRASGLSRGDVLLRAVEEGDLPVLFDQQTDPEANRMAAFTAGDSTDRDAFMARWKEILADGTITKETILVDGSVVGHVLSFESSGKREVSYRIGSLPKVRAFRGARLQSS